MYEIESIHFGVFSSEEIKSMAVCEINSFKKKGAGSVYDLRMGSIENNEICETCNQNFSLCHGHFGYIALNENVINPLFIKSYVPNFLKCICSKCNRLVLSRGQLKLLEYMAIDGLARFNLILKRVSKISICGHKNCKGLKYNVQYNTNDCNIYLKIDKTSPSIMLSDLDIYKIFSAFPDKDVSLLGFNPQQIHPKNFVIRNLLVIPQACRPYVKSGGSEIADDDLTCIYIDIVKINLMLANPEAVSSENKRRKIISKLKFKIATLFDNSKKKARHTSNSRPLKGIKERIAGSKDSLIRGNICGKRCNQTARTVIGPDPTINMLEINIPNKIARKLTTPVYVTAYNYDKVLEWINSGKAKKIVRSDGSKIVLKYALKTPQTKLCSGDIIVRNSQEPSRIPVLTGKEILVHGDQIMRKGVFLDKIKIPTKKIYDSLHIGDCVNRILMTGDYLLLNRQPTLHAQSMMAFRIRTNDYKNISMNLSVCRSFNADFDGDEMNIHSLQSSEALAEIQILSTPASNIISAQSSKPILDIVQDSLLAIYKMTLENSRLEKDVFFNIISNSQTCESIDILGRIQFIQSTLSSHGKPPECFNGRGLISMILPPDFNYFKTNNASDTEKSVVIISGVVISGAIDKQIVGASYNSIIQTLNKEYGGLRACRFIDDVHFLTNNWLMYEGFSIGLADCLVSKSLNDAGVSKSDEISDYIQKCFLEADGIRENTRNAGIKEVRVNAALGKAKDVGLRIAKDALDKNNNFITTVRSGSKGDFFNIAQITGVIGQQNIKGLRIPYQLNNGTRALPHYPFELKTSLEEYESRGFISSSFIHGLNPLECYFHATAGRDALSDTAMGTSNSGYMQRRIVKLIEDIKITYSGTVTDAQNNIYQFMYANDGFDRKKTVLVGDSQEFCNVSRIVHSLNHAVDIQTS